MRILIMTVYAAAMLAVGGCDYLPEAPKPIEKIIIEKQAPVENRFSGGDFFFGSGSITKSRTVYYLIADDGTVADVGLSDYARQKIGEPYATLTWEVK